LVSERSHCIPFETDESLFFDWVLYNGVVCPRGGPSPAFELTSSVSSEQCYIPYGLGNYLWTLSVTPLWRLS